MFLTGRQLRSHVEQKGHTTYESEVHVVSDGCAHVHKHPRLCTLFTAGNNVQTHKQAKSQVDSLVFSMTEIVQDFLSFWTGHAQTHRQADLVGDVLD